MSVTAKLSAKLDALEPLPPWVGWLAVAGRLVVGAMFIFSGLAKVMDAQSFMAALPSYQIPGWLVPLGALVPPVELLLGTMLLLGVSLGTTAAATMAMLVVFSGLLVVGIIGGELGSCGCFGSYLEMSPGLALLRNLGLALLTAAVWVRHRKESADWLSWQMASLGGLLLVSAVGTGYTIEAPRVDNSLAQVGEFFPDEWFVDETPAMDGQLLLFVFAVNCEHCWNAVANIKQLAAGGDPPLVGITSSDPFEIEWFRKTFDVEFPIYRFDPAKFSDAFNYWPALYMLEDGFILGKEEDDIPGLKTFREMTLGAWES
ncbi:MAG: DoxX family membrane protein [Candidatus Marinimicrobia bacterium]|nr:DoxX family membrane protein [Candidatus Neomarinimicrobiota bacterium]